VSDHETTLVIAAHPDDEVLGCGGTIARLTRAGAPVAIAILGEGLTSRLADRTQADPAELAALAECSRRAAAQLGVRDVSHFKLPDNRFDAVPLLEVVRLVEQVIVQVRPAVIYTHHGGDLNVDHAIVHRAVLTATRPTGDCPVRELLAFEVPSSTEWAFGQFAPAFRPNVFVDIAATLETKLAAMRTYESEARPFPHPRSSEALQALARRWGSAAGCEAAEGFELVRGIR